MSRFTSIKIKINNNEHLGTLLAEYGGDFEIKVWVLDRHDAWTGELSSMEAQEFISRYKITKEIFLEELRRALTSSDPDVLYSIDRNEDKGYVMSWKKCLDTGVAIKNGEMTVGRVSREDIYDEVLERSLEHNSQLQSQIDTLRKEREALFRENETVLTTLEKVVNDKESFERNVYSQFLSVLNAKKEKIAELRENLDELVQSRGSSSKQDIKSEVKKEPVSKGPLKLSQRNTQGKKEKIEEVDPFEVDTDVEEDSLCGSTPRPNKRDSIDTQSQSFNLDGFDEISSPVAVLPKRSKLNSRKDVKRNLSPSPEKSTEIVESGDDLLNQF